MWIPKQAQSEEFGPYPQLASGALDLNGFINVFRDLENPIDIAPCPYSRPFVLDLTLTTLPVFKQLTVFALALALGVLALSWKTGRDKTQESSFEESATASTPVVSIQQKNELDILYFLALGVGFMLVEGRSRRN